MKKAYVELRADVVLLQAADVLTTSEGKKYGQEGEVQADNPWSMLS